MDTGCVELLLRDGRMISIDCTGITDALDVTMAQRSELDYLIYNDPLHQEKPVHNVYWFFFFGAEKDLNRAAARSAVSNQPGGLLLSPRFPTRRNVYREADCPLSFLFYMAVSL